MSALRSRREEDRESPWDSESTSKNQQQKDVSHLTGATAQKGKYTVNGQVQESPEKYPYLKRQQELIENITKKVEDNTVTFESGSYIASPVGSTEE